jgi:hypothetical protein|tara:strand:- start:346 stop:765 length:420 start_codon:yes stop_codon:yes gene_type:complete
MMPIMALDTSGNWVSGDDLRIIECLKVPFGKFTLSCVQDCANELEDISADAVNNVRTALTEYETAVGIKTTADKDSKDPKVLVKADVLEWEKISGGEISGIQAEINRARGEVAQYFAFCSCLSGLLQYGKEEVTRVVRS